MSKPINVERKEMARKLRDYAGSNVEWVAPWAVFHDWNGDNSALLADLIDPVCELDLDTGMEHVKCSACGKAIPYGANLFEVKYCPNCGARVVSSNGQD